MSDISEPIQVIRVMFEGINIVLRITGATYKEAKSIVAVLAATLIHEKNCGKTSMRKLIKKGGNIKLLRVPEEKLPVLKKRLKKYGVLYSVMPDLKQEDGLVEIGFHAEASSRVLSIMQLLGFGEVIGMDEYIKGADTENITDKHFWHDGEEREVESKKAPLKEKEVQEKITYSTEEEIEQMMIELSCVDLFHNPSKEGVTVNVNLVEHDLGNETKIKLPYEKDKYIYLAKDEMFKMPNGKTYVAFLDKEKEYYIVDKDDCKVGSGKGSEIRNQHFDELSHYFKTMHKTTRTRKKKKVEGVGGNENKRR